MRRFIILFFVLIILPWYPSLSQEIKPIIARAVISDGDTLPVIYLKRVTIFSPIIHKNKRSERRFTKLVRDIKRVYPYARMAGQKLVEYDSVLVSLKTDQDRRRFMRKIEKELLDEYGDELKKLTFSQGKILLKLVDRETGNTSYELVSDLRGKIMAFFWQGIARIFGYNLKMHYDPGGEDKEIEQIVIRIEEGAL